jgi:hypothetical protein
MSHPTENSRAAKRIGRSWFWAGFRFGLALGPLWRALARNIEEPRQCKATSDYRWYCQKARGHFGPHIGTDGRAWK